MFEILGIIFFICGCLVTKDFYQLVCLLGLSGLFFLIGSIYNFTRKFEEANNLTKDTKNIKINENK